MKNNRDKMILICVLLLVMATIFGTLAYFNDTDKDVNAFTVGKVGIELDEANVNTDGTYVTDKTDRVKENKYHLVPGFTYIKDPTVTVDADSEPCYLYVKVENGLADIEGGTLIAKQMEDLGWANVKDNIYIFAKTPDVKDTKYVLYKGAEVVVFNSFTIDGNVAPAEIAEYESAEIKVTAYAIQAVGFEDATPAEIWTAAKFE